MLIAFQLFLGMISGKSVACNAVLGILIFLLLSYLKENSKSERMAENIYEFTVVDIDGSDVPLSNYRGKVCLVVNVASK